MYTGYFSLRAGNSHCLLGRGGARSVRGREQVSHEGSFVDLTVGTALLTCRLFVPTAGSIPSLPMSRRAHPSFHDLRQIPILTVAERLGMQLVPQGSRVWAMRDPESPRHVTSLRLFEKTNRWKRFSGIQTGGVSSGSTIDLVMHVRDCPLDMAVEFLKPLV